MKINFNKKASGYQTFLLSLIGLAVVVGVIGLFTFQVRQTAFQEEQRLADQEKTPADVSADNKAGNVVVLKSYATDNEANNKNTQIAVPAKFYTKKADGSFDQWIGGSAGYTLSASATTSVSPATIGQKVYGRAFNGTGTLIGYYGDENSIEVKTEGDSIALVSHAICRANQMQGLIYKTGSSTDKNLSLGASGADTFAQTKLRVNSTDCAYNLAGFTVDTTSGTNVNLVQLTADTSPLSRQSISLQRIKEKDDYVFVLDTPKMLHENEAYFTGTLSVTADADGCSSEEGLNLTAFDKAPFTSAISGKGIEEGFEDDQVSPSDVGGADVTFISNGRDNTVNGDGSTSFWCVP